MKEKEEPDFLKTLIVTEINGKKAAIHAYDKMMWMVRSGFLTLVFAGWSLLIKAAVENKMPFKDISIYAIILSSFSLVLAVGGYFIDRNYARRKFRVIHAINQLMQIAAKKEWHEPTGSPEVRLLELLKIAGDADNKNYRSGAYNNEILVTYIIYTLPSAMVTSILIYCLI